MPSPDTAAPASEVDVRTIPKPERHPIIFARFEELPVGGSFVLVNGHDPIHLRQEFEADLPGSYEWEYLNQEKGDWRIRITKRTSSALPRVLVDTSELIDTEPDATGAVWSLTTRQRDLDSNVIALPPDGTIETHAGPTIDVLVHVIAGTGTLTTEGDDIELRPGALVWLPRRSRRSFTAGPEGLRYLTVHQRRKMLKVGALD